MNAAPVHYHLGKFPPRELDLGRLVPLIGPANAGLVRYDGLLSVIPNAHILLSPLTTQEAVISSKIEGTHVTMGELLEIEAGGDGEISQPKRDDAEEVFNYRRAMTACVEAMKHRPLSQNLLKTAHSLLMQGVRGQDKSPGNYRTGQNYIGPKGCTIHEASYVPVSVDHLQSGMDAWEEYSASTTEMDVLIQLAILHVEFEALHPFMDGNGRLGRMFIPLFLFQRKLLSSPDFYMSGYLETNREEYQERLRAVSRDGDWTGWCVFFLKGICQQAEENQKRAFAILALYEQVKKEVVTKAHSQYAIQAVDFLFKTAVFKSTAFIEGAGMPKPTAKRILSVLREMNLLRTVVEGGGRRAAVYAFSELLNIAEGRNVF